MREDTLITRTVFLLDLLAQYLLLLPEDHHQEEEGEAFKFHFIKCCFTLASRF